MKYFKQLFILTAVVTATGFLGTLFAEEAVLPTFLEDSFEVLESAGQVNKLKLEQKRVLEKVDKIIEYIQEERQDLIEDEPEAFEQIQSYREKLSFSLQFLEEKDLSKSFQEQAAFFSGMSLTLTGEIHFWDEKAVPRESALIGSYFDKKTAPGKFPKEEKAVGDEVALFESKTQDELGADFPMTEGDPAKSAEEDLPMDLNEGSSDLEEQEDLEEKASKAEDAEIELEAEGEDKKATDQEEEGQSLEQLDSKNREGSSDEVASESVQGEGGADVEEAVDAEDAASGATGGEAGSSDGKEKDLAQGEGEGVELAVSEEAQAPEGQDEGLDGDGGMGEGSGAEGIQGKGEAQSKSGGEGEEGSEENSISEMGQQGSDAADSGDDDNILVQGGVSPGGEGGDSKDLSELAEKSEQKAKELGADLGDGRGDDSGSGDSVSESLGQGSEGSSDSQGKASASDLEGSLGGSAGSSQVMGVVKELEGGVQGSSQQLEEQTLPNEDNQRDVKMELELEESLSDLREWMLQEKMFINEVKKFKPLRQFENPNPTVEYFILKQKQFIFQLEEIKRQIGVLNTQDQFVMELRKLSELATRLLDVLNLGEYTDYESASVTYEELLNELESVEPQIDLIEKQVSIYRAGEDQNIPTVYRSAVSKYFQLLSES